MKLLERLALIKAGYTKKEIAAMEAEEMETAAPEQDPEQEPAKDEPEPQEPEPEEEPEQDPETPDYKKLYEDTKKQLEAAQQINVKVDLKNKPDESDAEKWQNLINDIL